VEKLRGDKPDGRATATLSAPFNILITQRIVLFSLGTLAEPTLFVSAALSRVAFFSSSTPSAFQTNKPARFRFCDWVWQPGMVQSFYQKNGN
jgi:hypothetical protein